MNGTLVARCFAVLLAVAAWVGLRWTDEPVAFVLALILSVPAAVLLVPPRSRCLDRAAALGVIGLLVLSYALYLHTGRDLGALYFAPLFTLCVALAAAGVIGRSRDGSVFHIGYIGYLLAAGLVLTLADGLDSEFRTMPEAMSAAVLREISLAQTALAEKDPAGYTADLRALGPSLATLRMEGSRVSDLSTLLAGSQGNRFSGHRYRFTFRPGPRDATGRIRNYEMTAQPDKARWRSFFVNETGVIRACPGYCTATVQDRPI